MLYLFGRLALSDSLDYYEGYQSDEDHEAYQLAAQKLAAVPHEAQPWQAAANATSF